MDPTFVDFDIPISAHEFVRRRVSRQTIRNLKTERRRDCCLFETVLLEDVSMKSTRQRNVGGLTYSCFAVEVM